MRKASAGATFPCVGTILLAVVILPSSARADADVTVTKTALQSAVAPGGTVTYILTIRNLGPDSTALTLFDAFPPSTTFVSVGIKTSEVLNVSTPPSGAGGALFVSNLEGGSVGANGSAEFVLVLRTLPSTPIGTQISNTATVTGTASDPQPANNTATAVTGFALQEPIPTLSSSAALGFGLLLAVTALLALRR